MSDRARQHLEDHARELGCSDPENRTAKELSDAIKAAREWLAHMESLSTEARWDEVHRLRIGLEQP